MRNTGKRVVITGTRAGSDLLPRSSCSIRDRVLVSVQTKTTLDSAREELGKNAIVMESDAASLTDVDALADRVRSEFGTFDVLFLNEGVTRTVPVDAMTDNAQIRVPDTHAG